jgi:FkbM family methyltransferase
VTPRGTPTLRAVARRVPVLAPVWRAARKRLLLRRGVGRLDYRGTKITIRTDTERIVRLRLHPVAKEPWTVSWIERNLRARDVLYDVGANVGAYSLIAAAFSRGLARVVAFEPGYANYTALCDNVLLNGLAESITPLPVVLGETTRLGTFSYPDTAAGAALQELDAEAGGVYRQPVLVHALDDLLERFALPPPTLIKLDVDGAEAAVLRGARRTLERPELRSLVVEVADEATADVTALLDGAGFGLAERFTQRAGQPLPEIWYGVFERRR